MLETAGYLLSRDPKKRIFLDGRPFSRRYQIENVLAFADSLRQPWRILECVCPEEVAKSRLVHDAASRHHPAGNRDFQLYLAVKSRFEAIRREKKLRIDTHQPLDVSVRQALEFLLTELPSR